MGKQGMESVVQAQLRWLLQAHPAAGWHVYACYLLYRSPQSARLANSSFQEKGHHLGGITWAFNCLPHATSLENRSMFTLLFVPPSFMNHEVTCCW